MAWQDAFRDYGFEVEFSDIRGQIGKGGDHLMPVFISAGDLKVFGDELQEHRARILKERYLPSIKAFPDVRALFERLRDEGVRVVLASSATGDELSRYEKIADIEGLAETAVSSQDADKSKPDPDIFEAALRHLGDIAPSDVVVVGDTPYDAEAASKAGLRTIGVLSGGFPEDDLRRVGCAAIYRDPSDLLEHLSESPLAA